MYDNMQQIYFRCLSKCNLYGWRCLVWFNLRISGYNETYDFTLVLIMFKYKHY